MRKLVTRLGRLVLVVVVVTFLTQLMTEFVPGSLDQILAPFSSPEQTAQIRKDLQLDDNVVVRYVRWLGDFVQGDMGKRYTGAQSSVPVGPEVGRALPVSLELMLWAQLVALGLAIPLGVYAGYRQGKWLDRIISGGAFAFLALPSYVVALMLSYYFAARFQLVRGVGLRPWSEGVGGHLADLILPVLSLALGQAAVYLRLLRSDLVATLQEDFIAVAKSKGLKPGRVLWRHALRPSSLTLLTVAGLQTGALIGGALVVEIIFAIPGMGSLIQYAITKRQYVELQSEVAVVAIVFVVVNFATDYLYSVLDPRIRE